MATEIEEYKLCIRHIPADLYTALGIRMVQQRCHMHDIVRAVLYDALLPRERSLISEHLQPPVWLLSVPKELDTAISSYASARGVPTEQQVIDDLCEMYGVEADHE